MSRLSASLIFLLISSTVSAECYMRSSTVKDIKSSITRIADVKRTVTPVNDNQFKCIVTFRAEINHVWHTAEAHSFGAKTDSIDQICSQALQVGRSSILQKVTGTQLHVEEEMVCRDDPLPEVRTVRIGDIVQLSELAPHPQKPNFFEYRGARCRWFVESDFDPVRRDVFQHQGIVCLVRKGEWQVIDKF